MAGNRPVLNYADQNTDRLVPITAYANELVVHMAASKLDGEGIRAVIEDHPRTAGRVRPARIKVFADDVPAAVSILMASPARTFVLDEVKPVRPVKPKSGPWPWIIGGIILAVALLCAVAIWYLATHSI